MHKGSTKCSEFGAATPRVGSCEAGGEVTHYRIIGGGHTWPGDWALRQKKNRRSDEIGRFARGSVSEPPAAILAGGQSPVEIAREDGLPEGTVYPRFSRCVGELKRHLEMHSKQRKIN